MTDVRNGGITERLNYHILSASNGIDAIKVFKQNSDIRLVILDVVMPKMGGDDAAIELRKLDNSIKIIFVTGYEQTESKKGKTRLKSEVVLSKPFSVSDFSKAIRDQLDS